MPTTARSSRAASTARADVLEQLKADHQRVKKAYAKFKKLDVETDPEACEALVIQVLDELTVHAALEEELLYPAAREALADKDTDLIDEAEVEHESVHIFIEQLRGMTPADEKYAARFIVLCEYVDHHVKEEEGELFPKLERAKLDWESLAAEMGERRAEMTPAANGDEADGDGDDDADAESAGARSAPAAKRAGGRSSGAATRKTATTGR